MRRAALLRLLVALLLGAVLVEVVSLEPGYVLIAIAGITVESTVWFVALSLILLTVAAVALLRLFRLPAKFKTRVVHFGQATRSKRTLAKEERVEQRERDAQRLYDSGEHAALADIIEQQLPKHWSDRLARLYGLADTGNPARRLARAERWLRDRQSNPELLLCTGRLCLRCQLWGRAESYLSASLTAKPSPAAHAELARLMERQGKREKSSELYRKGLIGAAAPLVELPEWGDTLIASRMDETDAHAEPPVRMASPSPSTSQANAVQKTLAN